MKLKFLMHKVIGSLLAITLIPSLAHAFQADVAHRKDYMGLTPHDHWDEVWHETMWDITIIGIIFSVTVLAFMVIYKRKAHGERGHLPHLSGQAKIGWVVLPCMLFLADDLFLYVKGFDLHNHYRAVPTNAVEVKVTASKWFWTYEDENGIETGSEKIDEDDPTKTIPTALTLEQGVPVVFKMMSDDVIHSHYMNRYRVTEDVMPGRVTYQWIMPDKLGKSVVTCREYCGADHSGMYGSINVVTSAEYQAYKAAEGVASAEPVDTNIATAEASTSTADRI